MFTDCLSFNFLLFYIFSVASMNVLRRFVVPPLEVGRIGILYPVWLDLNQPLLQGMKMSLRTFVRDS